MPETKQQLVCQTLVQQPCHETLLHSPIFIGISKDDDDDDNNDGDDVNLADCHMTKIMFWIGELKWGSRVYWFPIILACSCDVTISNCVPSYIVQ